MGDEGAAHYGPALEQLSLGRRFLRAALGPCGLPRVAWQIDPFGHSRQMAAIFAQVGGGTGRPPFSTPKPPAPPEPHMTPYDPIYFYIPTYAPI